MTRDEMTRAWWNWCEKHQMELETIPTFDHFRENILPTLEIACTEEEAGVY